MPATKVVVNIPGEEAYNVRIGSGVLGQLGSSMRLSLIHISEPTRH